jgi:hypothetical protein
VNSILVCYILLQAAGDCELVGGGGVADPTKTFAKSSSLMRIELCRKRDIINSSRLPCLSICGLPRTHCSKQNTLEQFSNQWDICPDHLPTHQAIHPPQGSKPRPL